MLLLFVLALKRNGSFLSISRVILPEKRQWVSDFYPCLKSEGCHLIPLSCLIFHFSAKSSVVVFLLVFVFSKCLVIFLLMAFQTFFVKTIIRVRPFCVAFAEQLRDACW